MCLPLGLLRFCVSTGALFSILSSLGLVSVAVLASREKKQITDTISSKMVHWVLISLYVLSILLLIFGISGLYGTIRKKTSGIHLYIIYLIGAIIFFLLSTAGGVLFLFGSDFFLGTSCETGIRTSLIQDLYTASITADNTLCRANCLCFVEKGSGLETQLSLKGGYKWTSNPKLGAMRYQDCNANGTDDSTVFYGVVHSTMEKLFSCGGWCPNDLKYSRFSDISQCVTSSCLQSRQTCHQDLLSFLSDKGKIVAIAFLFVSASSLINITFVLCLICHPSRSNRNKDRYTRLEGEA